ncbi:MAG: S8 family serine peptidase, partial [Firmicutes bacterium]|nr:S8 family serine peptidase [Bacillota bacterium]
MVIKKTLPKILLLFFLLVFLLSLFSVSVLGANLKHVGGVNFDDKEYVLPEDGEYVPDKVIVKLKQTTDLSMMSALAAEAQFPYLGISYKEARVLNPSVKQAGKLKALGVSEEANNVFALTIDTKKQSLQEALTILNKSSCVEIAEPDYIVHADLIPNDEYYGSLYGMGLLNMPEAWDITTGSSQIVVGVIDSGIDLNHPDLIDNIWVNPNPNSYSTYTNDINGYNFINNTGNPQDDEGHGTHCAGTIGAKGNNGIG